MPIRPPRRIFRSRSGRHSARLLAGRVRPALLAGALGAACIGVVMMLAMPSELFGRVPRLGGTLTAASPEVAVVDGQTLVLHRTVVRLAGIAAPSRGTQCRLPGLAGSAATQDCGAAAAAALASLVRGHDIACRLDGRDGEGFARGRCEADGTGLNRTLVEQGWARARGAGLAPAEREARAAKRGLWRGGSF
ncbi:MAG: thermonuclease family protein [Rhodospirillales bacterium]|nr:thermonuclease family protein [Rhodospirillales bacterium]